MRFLLAILFLFLFCIGFSQSNKKKVLVVPYGRFEFESKFSLEEISEMNSLAANEVFNAYQKSILNVFDGFLNDNFEFVAATDVMLNPVKKFIKYEDGKFDGKHHYAIKKKSFPLDNFTKLMDDNNASFIIFINWYSIQKASFTSKGKVKKRFKNSSHFIDYEIYNLFQQKIYGIGKERVKVPMPTENNAAFFGLRLSEVEDGYRLLVDAVIEILNTPITEN